MANITIDGKEYDIDALSDDAKIHLATIQFVDAELVRLQAHVAALQTARNAYGKELQKHLESAGK